MLKGFRENLDLKWYEAIFVRRSRRQFTGTPVKNGKWQRLETLVKRLNTGFSGARLKLINNPPDDVFKGAVGPYGKITGAPAYVAFIGNTADPNYHEKVGYLGQCLILETTALRLGTCWVSGFFKRETVQEQLELLPEEEVLAVSPIGYTADRYNFTELVLSKFGYHHKRKELESLCPDGIEEAWPKWVRASLEAARLAPSAINRQPWLFSVQDETIKISIAGGESKTFPKRLDCGIAMLQLELGALKHGVKGKWEHKDTPDVAVFKAVAKEKQ